jgi:hypothetical protein
MAENSDLKKFAEALVREVRDQSIASCDHLVAGHIKGPLGARWKAFTNGDERAALTALVPDVVDQVIFHLLDAIDNDKLPLGWRRADGTFAALGELGECEMAGRYMMGKGGWLDRFATQRFFDPLADLS